MMYLCIFTGGILAKIVGTMIDRKSKVDKIQDVTCSQNIDEETDTDFHESLPKEVLKVKDITIAKIPEYKKKSGIDFETDNHSRLKYEEKKHCIKSERSNTTTAKSNVQIEKFHASPVNDDLNCNKTSLKENIQEVECVKKIQKSHNSKSSSLSKQTDSVGSVIPVITISTTESDDEVLDKKTSSSKSKQEAVNKEENDHKCVKHESSKGELKRNRNCSDLKSLQRQSSVDSINENKSPKKEKFEESGHTYQYSL